MEYYTLLIDNDEELVLTLDQTAGNIDTNLYMRYNQLPTTSAYDYAYTGSADPKIIYKSACDVVAGSNYVGVYGDTTYGYIKLPYKITATLGNL